MQTVEIGKAYRVTSQMSSIKDTVLCVVEGTYKGVDASGGEMAIRLWVRNYVHPTTILFKNIESIVEIDPIDKHQ